MSKAQELAMQLKESLKSQLKEGVSNFGQEIGAEMKRLGTQGSMELASALFAGHAFVPYGPGQYTPSPEQEQQHQEQQQSHGMER